MNLRNIRFHKPTDTGLIIAGLTLLFCLAVLLALLCFRQSLSYKHKAESLEQQLYISELKQDYFQWRESNALGHNTDKSRYPRYEELQKLTTN